MAAPLSPLPPTVADRDAEIAALQTAFDEYIASSRELEDELDAELAKMQEKLAESSGANAALIAQLESINPQLSQLETALSDTKRKLDTESTARRQAELAQDEAEARAREFEASLDTTKAENDQVHEQLAFREEEVEEMRLELEVEKERHTVELEELATQLASKKGGAKATDEKKDDISVMSEDDFVTMAVGSTDGVANNDDNEDYIKRLEDELEDVTEQLIEAETNISNMEGKLNAAEKNKSDLEKKVVDMESEVDEIQNKLQNSLTEAAAKEEKDAAQASSEEVALLTEELALTQEELKAAEEDAQVAGANLERAQSEHKEQLSKLKAELDSAKNGVNNAKVEVETMEQALNEANSQTSTLRVEVENLMQALKNAKQDHEKTLDDMEALRQAFDEAENDVRETSIQREEDLVKEHNRQLENLVSEIAALTEANNAFKESTTKKSTGPSASEVDLQIKLDQKNSELERTKSDLIEAKDALQKSKRKIEELSAGNKSLINGAFDSPQKMTDILSSPSKMQIVERFNEDDEGAVSIFYRSHARSRSRMPHEPSYRARSSSPSTICRLERNFNDEEAKALTITKERDSLKSQQRMSDVRVEHLEADIAKLHTKVQEAEQKSDNLVSVVAGVSQNPEARDDKEFLDTEIETIIRDGDKDAVADEFRALARKSTMQKEHNAQLLMRILKLQGNIQVCCRVRPMTNGEIKRATKRVVEPLSDSEVGVFDNRTKSWKSFAFDKVWGPDSHQLGIFQDVEPLALSVVDGYNACIFAYGQTGSGKTYTMEGGQDMGIDRGISFRTIEKLFKLLQYKAIKQDANIGKFQSGEIANADGIPGRFEFTITVGMLEIYNDNVHDLLVKPGGKNGKKQSLEIKRDKEGVIFVDGLTKKSINNLKDVLSLLKLGNQSRAKASTELNEHSSRSHMVLTVEVKSGIVGEEPVTGTLYLVDLAGSERVRKSAVQGQALKEATQINKSLSALGNVMEALDRKASHIPYRDSKLTYLLQDSLGGNSRTMMVVAVCPTSVSSDETSHALQFATRVRRINLGSAKRNVLSKNLEYTVKEMSQQLRMLAKSKDKSEQQLKSLKKDHNRIQERLRSSSESRTKSVDEGRTLAVLKTSNQQMTARWQKEKQLHDKAVADLELSQNETKQLQSQLSKSKREVERFSKLVSEKESKYDSLKGDLRKAKDASSAANLRARKAQMLQSRHSNVAPGSNIVQPSRRGVVSSTPNKTLDMDPEEARTKVLAMLKEHDPKKVDKIDAIMDRFKGRERFLLVKMSARYIGESSSQHSSSQQSSSKSKAGQRRSDVALARHMERMRSTSSIGNE